MGNQGMEKKLSAGQKTKVNEMSSGACVIFAVFG